MLSVFLFSHQDDEVGCLGSLERAQAAGLRPVCLYLTDGSGGAAHPEQRCAETLAVLTRCGVRVEDIHFIGCQSDIKDGRLSEACAQALSASEEILLGYGGLPIAELHLHAWEGGHPDHDAAHLVGLALAMRLGCLEKTQQFALYHGAGVRYGFFRVLSPLRENGPVQAFPLSWRAKAIMLRLWTLYPSQIKTWVGLFPFIVLHLLFWGSQQTQPVSIGRVSQRPHAGPLLYEERGMSDWSRFCAETERFLAEYVQAPHLGSGVPLAEAV